MIISKNSAFLQKKIFWVSLITAGIAGAFFTSHYFNEAFPIVSIDISMNREKAISASHALATDNNWAVEKHDIATSFDTDSKTQTFVELECGGVKTFTNMMENELYQPYLWHTRYFEEYNPYEAHLFFYSTRYAVRI